MNALFTALSTAHTEEAALDLLRGFDNPTLAEAARDILYWAGARDWRSPEWKRVTDAACDAAEAPAEEEDTATRGEEAPFSSVVSAEELLKKEFPPVAWIAPRLIPAEGLTLLAGAPKVGKSWFALQLALAVAAGHELWDTETTRAPRPVLYLALEDNGRRLQKRLRALGAETGCCGSFDLATGWPAGAEGAARVETYLDAKPGTALVIIDTLGRFFGPHDANSYSDVTLLAGRLQTLATGRKTCVLGVHHTRKSAARDGGEAGDWQDGVLGSQGLAGAADCTLLLQKGRGQNAARLRNTGRDVEHELDLALTLDIDGAMGWRVEGDSAEVLRSDTRRRIASAVREAPPEGISPKAVYDAISAEGYRGGAGTVRKVMADMEKAGELHTDKRGRYRRAVKHGNSGNLVTTQAGEAADE